MLIMSILSKITELLQFEKFLGNNDTINVREE
jgi:hypothetical protein